MDFIYKNISLGSDPEFFIQDKDGKLISSIGLIMGKKDNPQQLPILGLGYAIQTDNVLGEFNVPHAYSASEVAENVNTMKAYIAGFLEPHNLEPLYAASGIFTEDQLDSDEAKQFGCSPDYDAWKNDVNFPPEGQATNLRSAGFHIHVGYDDPNYERNLLIIKAMDLFLGVPSIMIDTDSRRRELYGKAGCFRNTDFGVEYRVLSGFMINNKKLIKWSFNQAIAAIKFLNTTENVAELLNSESESIVSCINSGNAELSAELVKKYSIKLPY